jgi:hypothetical protein
LGNSADMLIHHCMQEKIALMRKKILRARSSRASSESFVKKFSPRASL